MTSRSAFPEAPRLLLTEAEVAAATRMGNETFHRWQGRRGHYRNLERSHRLGKLGEIGVARWAEQVGVSPIDRLYEDEKHEREADLLLGRVPVDVKTWSASTWAAWGRCVATSQFETLMRKALAVIWAFVDERDSEVWVTVAGWSTLHDIAAAPVKSTGPPHAPVINHQVDPNQVRSPGALVSGLLEGKTLR